MKFRPKKIVDAVQWLPGNVQQIRDLYGKLPPLDLFDCREEVRDGFPQCVIRSPDRAFEFLALHPGDWLVWDGRRGTHGNVYTHREFIETFESVPTERIRVELDDRVEILETPKPQERKVKDLCLDPDKMNGAGDQTSEMKSFAFPDCGPGIFPLGPPSGQTGQAGQTDGRTFADVLHSRWSENDGNPFKGRRP